MITYFLIGGDIGSAGANGNSYYQAFISKLEENLTILVIPFARDESEWEQILQDTQKTFDNYKNGLKLSHATIDPDEFLHQVKNSRGILIKGGSTENLIKLLHKVGFASLDLSDKVISASSAGVYALSKSYFSLTNSSTEWPWLSGYYNSSAFWFGKIHSHRLERRSSAFTR
jgi:hypothetical protein